MHRVLSVLTAALLTLSAAQAQELRVVDGDTFWVGDEKIRLFGIDAPEAGQTCTDAVGATWDCSSWATERLSAVLGAGQLRCRGDDRDRYGRLLATCSVAGRDVGESLVSDGAVRAFRRFSSRYVAAEEAARAAGRGIWAGASQAPWDYRATASSNAQSGAPAGCRIKGNISDNGRIYHMPGQENYARTRISLTRGERWFCSEAEARAAGWRKAGR